MKIAQLHWAFPPIIGGVESHLVMLGPELVKNNCKVSLLTGLSQGLDEEEYYEGLYIRRTPLMDLNSLSPKVICERAGNIRQEFFAFIDQVKPDVIHAHNMHYFSPVHAEILAEIKEAWGIPLVLTAHNVWPDDDKTWQVMNKKAHIWDAVIAVSDYIKRELVRVGYDERRITVVHHGIDLNRFTPATSYDVEEIEKMYPEFSGRRVIFHPARMKLEKGCHISVKALDIIRRKYPDVLLVMAGTEKAVDWKSEHKNHVNEILDLIDKLDLRSNVFIRFFSWDQMPSIYKAAEFCMYPSCFEEPFGLTMLESMASERPMIVSRAGGMPEVIQNGLSGFIVEIGNHEELAEKCCLLLDNPSLCKWMGRQGKDMVGYRWSKQVMVNSTISVYRNAKLSTKVTDNSKRLA